MKEGRRTDWSSKSELCRWYLPLFCEFCSFSTFAILPYAFFFSCEPRSPRRSQSHHGFFPLVRPWNRHPCSGKSPFRSWSGHFKVHSWNRQSIWPKIIINGTFSPSMLAWWIGLCTSNKNIWLYFENHLDVRSMRPPQLKKKNSLTF